MRSPSTPLRGFPGLVLGPDDLVPKLTGSPGTLRTQGPYGAHRGMEGTGCQ